MIRFLLAVIALYVLVLLLLFIFQRKLIYLPSRGSEAAMQATAEMLHLTPWRDAGGSIIGWKKATTPGAIKPANRLIVFHGNAGFALARSHFVTGFGNLGGGTLWDVHLFEYPGFGARPGPLGEKTFVQAARAAIAQLTAEDRRPIFLLGESLGSGPACALAGAEPDSIAGLLLITPYRSLAEVAQHHYPIVPVRLLLRDRWENTPALQRFHRRVAFLLASDDEVIPVTQGRQLFESANEPKRLWVAPGATHNRLPYEIRAPWWREVSDFLLNPKPEG